MLHEVWAHRWSVALSDLLSSVGYGIVLWAINEAPIASVSTLRNSSVLFAALVGVFIFKEGFNRFKAAAVLLIIAGTVLIRIGG